MLDTNADAIIKMAAQGESQLVEFKERLPSSESIGKVLISFANADGGVLLIGVRDDGEISGLSGTETLEAINRVKGVAESLFPYPIGVNVVPVQGKNVVRATIDKAPKEIRPIMAATGDIYKRKADRIVKIIRRRPLPFPKSGASKEKPTPKRMKVFVAMSFRHEEEPSLIDYYKAMERASKNTKLPIDIYKMDLVDGDYEISQKIMDEIDKSQVVVTDFTLNSRNVYFELGYARGKGRKVIQTARKDTVLEFDVRNCRTTFYRNATELEEKLYAVFISAYKEANK